MARNNPYGANQYKVDPRQALFLANYLDPKSKTFANAKQSAISAGYSEEYANHILTVDLEWLSENVRYENIIKKAEKNLDEFMTDEDAKIRADMTKFALSRLKKDKFSERQEHTGKDGRDLIPTPIYGGLSTNPTEN